MSTLIFVKYLFLRQKWRQKINFLLNNVGVNSGGNPCIFYELLLEMLQLVQAEKLLI